MAKPPSPFAQFTRDLLERIGSRVAAYGYVSRLREQRFVQPTQIGSRVLHLGFISRPEYRVVHADVALRVDAVEELKAADSDRPRREARNYVTVGAELGNIADGRWHSWYVRPEHDIDLVADEIVGMFTRFGLPYLERVSHLETLLDILADEGPASTLYSPFPESRCRSAVALALVLGLNDRAGAIAAQCGRNFRRQGDGNAHLFAILDERGVTPPGG